MDKDIKVNLVLLKEHVLRINAGEFSNFNLFCHRDTYGYIVMIKFWGIS